MNEIAPSNTLTPEQAFPFQREIDTWSVEEAVARVRPKVEQLKSVSLDVARDLWIAHEALAQRGGDRRSEDAQTFGFCDFLELVGLSKKTAYLWLKLYDAANDRVLTPEEYAVANAKGANPEIGQASPEVLALQNKREQLIAHAMATGERLYEQGWNELCRNERAWLRKGISEKGAQRTPCGNYAQVDEKSPGKLLRQRRLFFHDRTCKQQIVPEDKPRIKSTVRGTDGGVRYAGQVPADFR